VLTRFLRALGVPSDSIPLDLDEQAALYRSMLADKRVLVVLDNANSADHVRPLLPAGSDCAVLVTSRDDLRGLTALQGASRFALDVLTPAEAIALLDSIVGDNRITAEPQSAAELARLCGYLPLALGIAAANLSSRPYLPIQDYVSELRSGNRLAELAIQGDEQAAVRVAFDMSYAALKPDEARLFRFLSLVPGPDFTVHAAAALIDTSVKFAMPLLGHLRMANLISDCGPGRFQFHDLLRHYSMEQSEAAADQRTRDEALTRLLALYFQATATSSGLIEPVRDSPKPPPNMPTVELPDLPDVRAARSWLEQEDANLQAAVTHAADHGPYPLAWHLADAMTSPLAMTSRFTEWMAVAETGLRAALLVGDERGEAIMRISLGHACNTTGLQDLAIVHLSRALTLYQQLDLVKYQIPCHYAMSMAYLWTGKLPEAIENLNATMELSTRLGIAYYHANAVHGLGVAHRYLGELQTGLAELTESLKIGANLGDPYGQATWRFSLGLTLRDLGRFDEAIDQLNETLRGFRQVSNSFGEGRTLIGLSGAYLALGRVSDALDAAQRAHGLSREIKHRRAETDALNALAAVLDRLDQLDEALDLHEEALAVAEDMGPYWYGMIEARIGVAAVLRRLGRWDTARAQVDTALADIRTSKFQLYEGKALITLADIEFDLGDRAAAALHYDEALAVYRHTGQRLGEARALDLLGRITQGSQGQALRDQARELFTEIGVQAADELPAGNGGR
jgi:tetratricopeptide (TPR) repeat protein